MVRIRKFSIDDLAAVVSIQKKTPQAAQWTETDYTSLADDPSGLVLVAEPPTMDPTTVMGFVAFRRIFDEAELRNMAVDPAYQRRGVGRQLLGEGRRRLLEQGVKHIYLEVRASNVPAQTLYCSAGFALRSRRRDYYNDPREDALVLWL